MSARILYLLPAILLVLPGPVLAHEAGSLPLGSFIGGLTHPVLGPDHFLAMVSVGILSAQIGGRAIWTVPATFVLVMALGGVLGMLEVPLSAVELGIAFSVLVLGIAIAADRRLPLALAMCAVGFFAVFHGYAHGAEMPTVAEPVRYAAGFMSGTAALHVLGVIIGDVPRHYAAGKLVLRLIGGGIAGIGSWFVLGMV
jgi:urease accessory protein